MLTRRLFNKLLALGPLAPVLGTGKAFAQGSALAAAATATATAAEHLGQEGLPEGAKAIGGRWEATNGGFRQTQSQGTALLLVHRPNWDEPYTAKVSVRPSLGEGLWEAGLVLHYRDPKNFLVYSLANRKGGHYAVLRYEVSPGYSVVADQARLKVDQLSAWHELAVDVFGHHIYAYFDGQPIVSYSFIGVSPPSHTNDGVLWPDDPTHGQVGVCTVNAAGSFTGLEVTRRPKYDNVITPQLARHDPEGQILPRQSYAETMKQFTEWMIGSDAVVDNSRAPAALRHLAPYLLTNWIESDDTIALHLYIQEFAINHSLLISGAVRYYTFSGDNRTLEMAAKVADWHLGNRTPADYALPYLPPSTVGWQPDGSWKGQAWGLEPDKSAFMGICLLKLWAVTGRARYKEAALQIAATLRKLQRPDGGWPFRVDPQTGEVKCEYTESALWYVKFYDQIAGLTASPNDQTVARRSFDWLLRNPVKTNDWRRLYGDVPCGMRSYDQWVPLETAMYLLDHRSEDPQYVNMAREILKWINHTVILDPGLHQGLPGIAEQTVYRVVLSHHELRLANFYAKLWETTRQEEYRRLAVQIANSVTWCLMSDGKMRLGLGRMASRIGLGLIINDQFADMMSALPETAPSGENHLLRTTGDVARIEYESHMIKYSTVGLSEDVLVVVAAPRSVTSGGKKLERVDSVTNQQEGWSFNSSSKVLHIRHAQRDVAVRF